MPIIRTDATLANGGESRTDNQDTAVNNTDWRTWTENPLSPDDFFYLREPNRQVGAGGQREPAPNGGGTGATAGGKNPLHKFSSYAWMWSLCCLSKGETNFPDSIKGKFTAGIPVAIDFGASDYHFDKMSILGLTAPNAHIRNTHSINFEFDIVEPYSLGNFIEDLDDAASAQGWANYADAGWMLGLKFDGWDDNGNNSTVGPYNFVVKLVDAKFKYTEAGTVYNCTAIAWNDQAWNDENATVKTSGQLIGNKLKDVCFYSQNSLTALLNQQEIKKQQKGDITEGDQYYVVFPKTKTSAEEAAVLTAAAQAAISDYPIDWQEDWDKERGISGSTGDAGRYRQFGAWVADNKLYELGGSKSANTLGPIIYDFYKDANKIGESEIIKHPFDKVRNRNAPVRSVRADENPAIFQNRYNLLDEKSGAYDIRAGTRIIDIIHELILASAYGREEGANGKPDGDNKVNWYKIQCWVVASGKAKEADAGRTAKTYIYRVIAHKASLNRFSAPGSKGKGGGGPARTYNYIYTGLNNDVLELDLNWNAAFYVPLQSDLGHNTATVTTGVPEQQGIRSPDVVQKQRSGGGADSADGVVQTFTPAQKPGTKGVNVQRHLESNVNRDWHNILMNSDVDLLQIEMKIHGDPVYLQSNGCGNYICGSSGNLTKDGDLEYINSEADIQINFNTPPDLGVPWTSVGQYRFTGLYQVIQVKSEFNRSEGFTQKLDCIRYRNQGGGTSDPVYQPGGTKIADEPENFQNPDN